MGVVQVRSSIYIYSTMKTNIVYPEILAIKN